MKKRAVKVGFLCLFGVAAGILYAVFVLHTGLGIPCAFHMITGLLCPGCGVTRMLLSLMRGDFAGAWRANAMLMVLSPFLLYILADSVMAYVRAGSFRVRRWQEVLLYIMIGMLVVFAAVRNLFYLGLLK